MLLRTQLAQEKASFAIVKQELRDQAVREVGVAKAAHSRQAKELEVKLKAVAAEKGRLEAGLGEATTKLKCKLRDSASSDKAGFKLTVLRV